MYPGFAKKVGLQIWYINVGTMIINNFKLDIFDMAITTFLIKGKDKKSWFFQKTFLLANISIDIIALEMFFFTLNNIKVNFDNQNLS